MEISSVVKKPELIKITLDDAQIIDVYGEPIEFWMKDFVDIDTYFQFFQSQAEQEKDVRQLGAILKKIVLKADGSPAIGEDEELPLAVVIPVITKVTENLGKSKAKLSTPIDGAPQE
jgi:hypothetical protein